MYHLTCPSCQDVTDSHFVRSGAVVRCPACESKFRIKSAHFVREIESGPRTLDESDSILRSDSVDIDPDEVAPVSIDDEGNVVGLSGLSELMRWSDNQNESQVTGVQGSDKSAGKSKAGGDALPEAKSVSKKTSSKTKEPAPLSGRERAQAIKRKKRNKTLVAVGGAGVVALIVAVILAINLSSQLQSIEDATTEDNTKKQDNPAVVVQDPGTDPDPSPRDPDIFPDTGPDKPGPDGPDEVLVFSEDYKPSPNPDIKFAPPWVAADTSAPPSDVPTVLTPAKAMTHEGWYVMTPPRGPADASGVGDVELGQITASAFSDSDTLLAGEVANNSERAVMNGELHLMLLDSTGNVFAETYTPLAMIKPRSRQAIALTIPTRYWRRSRGVRAGVQVMDWADNLEPIEGVQLKPAGQGDAAALRVSIKHQDNRPLRSMMMLLTATDTDGNAIARFLVKEESLYIAKDHWLDLVVATPLPDGQEAVQWSAVMHKP